MKRKCDPLATSIASAQSLSEPVQDPAVNQTSESNTSISLQHRAVLRQTPSSILNSTHLFHAQDPISVAQPDHSNDSVQSPRSAKVTLLDSRSSPSISTSDPATWLDSGKEQGFDKLTGVSSLLGPVSSESCVEVSEAPTGTGSCGSTFTHPSAHTHPLESLSTTTHIPHSGMSMYPMLGSPLLRSFAVAGAQPLPQPHPQPLVSVLEPQPLIAAQTHLPPLPLHPQSHDYAGVNVNMNLSACTPLQLSASEELNAGAFRPAAVPPAQMSAATLLAQFLSPLELGVAANSPPPDDVLAASATAGPMHSATEKTASPPTALVSNWLSFFDMLSPNEQETATMTLLDRLWSTRRLQPLARLAHDRLNSFFNFDIVSQCPPEIAAKIFSYLDPISLVRVSNTCKHWRSLAADERIWRQHAAALHLRPRPRPRAALPLPLHSAAADAESGAEAVANANDAPRSSHAASASDDRRASLDSSHQLLLHQRPSTRAGGALALDTNTTSRFLETPRRRRSSASLSVSSSASASPSDSSATGAGVGRSRTRKGRRERSTSPLPTYCSSSTDSAPSQSSRDLFLHYLLAQHRLRTGDGQLQIEQLCHEGRVITCLELERGLVVSGSDSGEILVWDMYTGKRLRSLVGHEGGVWCSQLSVDACVLVTGSTDRSIRIWDMSSGETIHEIRQAHHSTVRCLSLFNDKVASGSRDSSVKLWNIRSGHCVHHLTGHLAAVRCVQYNGRIVVSGSYDFSILIWNAETGARMHQLQGHGNRIYSLLVWPPSSSQSLGHPNLHPFHPLYPFSSSASSACGPSGCGGSGPAPRELIISGSLDTHVKVWDLNTGDLVHTLSGHSSLTSSMEVANNGQTLITANADQTIRMWDLNDGRCLNVLAPPGHRHSSALTCIQLTRRYIVSASDDGTVKLWCARTGAFIRDLLRLESAENGAVVWRIRATETHLVCACGSRTGNEPTKLVFFSFDALDDELRELQQAPSPVPPPPPREPVADLTDASLQS